MTPVPIWLTEQESFICTWVGKQRRANAAAHNRNPGQGTNDRERRDILGAHCEYASSIALNLYWRPNIGVLHAIDVGGLVEVRGTELKKGRLVIKPRDKNVPFVLVVQDNELLYSVVGWINAAYAKENYELTVGDFDPAHYIPQEDLSDIGELKRLVTGWTPPPIKFDGAPHEY